MKLQKITLICAILFTFFVSCNDEKNVTQDGNRVKATFTAGISTRATDVMWDINDAIGVTMMNATETQILEDVLNKRYYTTTTTGNFIPASTDDIIYFPQDGEEVRFKAYYPYAQGIGSNLQIPVSVADQSDLTLIDFMSAEHLTGFSKEDSDVSLRFYHRLSKLIFRLNVGDGVNNLPLQDVTLTVKGMFTTGTYDLINETLTVDENSQADLVMQRQSAASERMGIVLPREAEAGVSFELTTPEGSQFAVDLDDDFAFDPGYKYIFNITLEGTELSFSVTIEDWVEGPITNYDVLGITTPAGESTGVIVGDQMQVYLKNGNNYENLALFTYGSDGRWTTTTPIFWEDLGWDPINLRASIIPREPAANDTQLPDYILAEELSVERNNGADLVFSHAGSRVSVVLQSNVFTADELAAATIVLPSYLTGAVEDMGVLVPGTTRDDVIIDQTDPTDKFAIIQPQPVSPNAALVQITVNGRDFTARATDEGFLYEAGVAYQLIIMINESDVSVNARVIDWTPSGPHEFDILEVVSNVGDTEGVEVGTRMNVFLSDGTNYNPWTSFTYTGDNKWLPDNEIYWESISGNSVDLRASIVAKARLNQYQMDDLLIADDITVPYATGVDFVFRHVASRLVVRLISDTFSQSDLDGATITLPQYVGGGVEENGQFIPGQALQDIPMVIDDGTNTRAVASTDAQVALIQPQTIGAGKYMFRVRIGTRDYYAVVPNGGFTYEAGVSYGITIHVNENNVTVSAQVIPWEATSFELNAFRIGTTLPGSSSGISNGEQMEVYISEGASRVPLSTFTYSLTSDTWTANPEVFWESITGTPAFYGSILRANRLNDTQLDDYLVADPVTPVEGMPVNFTLRHPAAQVVVQLKSDDGTFSDTELPNMNITLPNYIMGGEINNGLFEFPASEPTGTVVVAKTNNTGRAIIRPQTINSGQIVVNVNDPNTGRDYPVIHSANIQFAAGYTTTLIIDMSKTLIGLSANVVEWEEGMTIPLVADAITITGSLNGTDTFFNDKTIYAYILGDNFTELTYGYLPDPDNPGIYTWQGTRTLYWNDYRLPLRLTGVYYPFQAPIPPLGAGTTSFVWEIGEIQSGGYDQYDLLMSPLNLTTYTYANFNFEHVVSKIRVRIVSDEFTASELEGATVQLNNLRLNGSVSLINGTATVQNGVSNITPYIQTTSTGTEYSALVMPQTVTNGTQLVTITLRDYPNNPFPGVLDANLTFVAGKEHLITLTLRKTEILISAQLEEWTDGDTGSITIQ